MHTLKVLAGGLALLVLCLLGGRALGSTPAAGLTMGVKVFVALWFVAAAVNMWLGVSRAGYSVAEEAPVFVYVFGLPVAIAVALWWWLVRRGV